MNDTAGAPAPFDISAFELEDIGTLTVQNAKGDDDLLYNGNPVKIEFYGPGTEQTIKAEHKAGLAVAKRLRETFRGGKISPQEAQKADEEVVDKLVARTKSIINFPISPRELYSNPRLSYIRQQAIRYIGEDANFSKASPTDSASTSDS